MSKQKKPGSGKPADRHLSGKMVRLGDDVHGQLMKLAERNDRPLTRELRRVVIAMLEAEGLWPPPDRVDTV